MADGVGGWSSEGVDSSYFSKALMNSCAKVAKKELADLDKPVDILTRALRETLWLHSKAYGEYNEKQSTDCVLKRTSLLKVHCTSPTASVQRVTLYTVYTVCIT